MIREIIKRVDEEKLELFYRHFEGKSKYTKISNDKIIFGIDELESEMIDFIENNFNDFVETELRLDALEAQMIGEQSTFSKIRDALKL